MNPIRRMLVTVAMAGVVTGAAPVMAGAQTLREDPATFVVVGAVYQRAVFGDDNPKASAEVGPTIGLLFRSGRSGRSALTLEIVAQPNPPHNPHYQESFAPIVVMAGAQMGRRTYVRLSGGVTTVTNIAPMLGIAVGIERPIRSRRIGLEVVTRAGGSPGVFGGAMGVQGLWRF
jgi:hypothetical protein